MIEIQNKGYGFEEQELEANENLSLILNIKQKHNSIKKEMEEFIRGLN